MTDTHAKELQTLEKVESLVQRHPQFDDEELEALKKVIKLVRGLELLGSFAAFIKTTIIWLGIVIGAFIAVKNGAIEFILEVIKMK